MKIEPSTLLAKAGISEAEPTDPLVVAIEAACAGINQRQANDEAWVVAAEVQNMLPPNATDFERGLAGGIAFGLMAAS